MGRKHLNPPSKETWGKFQETTKPSRERSAASRRHWKDRPTWLDMQVTEMETLICSLVCSGTREEAADAANRLWAKAGVLKAVAGVPKGASPNMASIPNLDTCAWKGSHPAQDAFRQYTDTLLEAAARMGGMDGEPTKDTRLAMDCLWEVYVCIKALFQVALWNLGLYGGSHAGDIKMQYR